MVSVAEFVRRGNPPPNVVKIDVEGAEGYVLAGLEPLMSSGAVRDLLIEFHHERLSEAQMDAHQLESWIESLGYRVVYSHRRGTETHCHFQRTVHHDRQRVVKEGVST
jgi:hypothetical protein